MIFFAKKCMKQIQRNENDSNFYSGQTYVHQLKRSFDNLLNFSFNSVQLDFRKYFNQE